jgi:methyl-accepting chemotaxis protein
MKKQTTPAATETLAQDLKKRTEFLNIGDQDADNLIDFREAAIANMEKVVGRFYEHLLKHDETRAHFQSEKHIQTLRKTQSEYFARLFSGEYDAAYAENRIVVGRTHERIGLGPQWYIGAYSMYLCELMPVVFEHYKGKPAKITNVLQSVVKMICLDMGFAIDTYIEALQRREAEQVDKFVTALGQFHSQLSGASSAISAATTQQTAAVQQQSTSVAEVTSTLSELRQTSSQSLEKAEAVIQVAEKSVDASQTGAKSVEAAVRGMKETRDQVGAIADRILALSEQTQQISDIITSVNEIAEQSKLLALNAAIEAARAGEHGKGFAVVATEIRSLADQSKQATAQVRKILGDIQSATNSVVIVTDEGSKRAEQGMQLATSAGENIHQLSGSIEESADAARLIANAARQQSAGVQQVADAMVSVNEALNSTLQALRQTEDQAGNVLEMMSVMNELMETFSKPKTKDAQYQLA